MRTTMLLAVALVAMVLGANAGAVDLTGKTFDAEVMESGKGAFIKFFAPWCGHCKSLKPAWDKLGDEFKGSKTILIGDVDCTKDDNKDLCQKYGVSGYPTLKYFTGATSAQGDAYNGGRDFDALSAWAKENLGPSCGAENIDLCDAEQKKSIEEKQALSPVDLDKEIDTLEAELKASDEELEELLKSLQANYEAGKKKKDDTIAALSPKLSLLRSIKRAKGGDDAKEL
mmetsp:Transcript_1030/g.1469  ORF Transcript_1030/g.1469 Transcript_1030/m.1469 type:complete len:228 (+) Transcript_1030:62-745(+)